jgi:hypothetical protein
MSGYYGDFVIPEFLATQTDYLAYTGAQVAPANMQILLRSASAMVQDATSTAYYETDPLTGLPTDTQVSGALTAATCAQAAAWDALGYNPLLGGVADQAVLSATSIGTAHINYADGALVAAARSAAISGLVPDAVRVLELSNLLTPRVWTYG